MYKLLISVLFLSSLAFANQKAQGWCEDGNYSVTIPGGAGPSVNKYQRSFPACTVTVYVSGTLTLATIYSDNSSTAKANPFTAANSGQWFFYAANGTYDVKFSGGGIPAPFTLGAVSLFDASVACSATFICQGGNAFGTTLIIGTTDTQNVIINRAGVNAVAFSSSIGVPRATFGGDVIIPGKLTVTGIDTFNGTAFFNGAVQLNAGFTVVGNVDFSAITSNLVLGGVGGNATGSLSATTFTSTCIGSPSTPVTGSVTLFCNASDNKLYYKDSGGLVTGPLGSGGGGGPFWNASTTVGGVNTATVATYLGTHGAGGSTVFVSGSTATGRGILNDSGHWGFNTLSPSGNDIVEIDDTTGGLTLGLVGPVTGGTGVVMHFYETTTLAGQITVAKGSAFAIAGAGATPITLNSNSNLLFKAYNSGADLVGQFQGTAEWIGTVTANQGLSGANNGRIIYDKTLQHFYASENGGAYFRINAGGGGTGWPVGSAANTGTYTGANDCPGTCTTYWLGLNTANGMGIATNGIGRGIVTYAGAWGINTLTPNRVLEVSDTGNANTVRLTGTAGTGEGIEFFDSVARASIIASNTSLAFATASGGNAIPTIFYNNGNETLRMLTNNQILANASTALSPYTTMEIRGTGAGQTSAKGNPLLLNVVPGGALHLILSYNGGGQAYLAELGGINTTLHDTTEVTVEGGGNNLTVNASGVSASNGTTTSIVIGTCTITVSGGIVTGKSGSC